MLFALAFMAWIVSSFVLLILSLRRAQIAACQQVQDEPGNTPEEIRCKVDAAHAVYLWLSQYKTHSYEENMRLLETMEYRP